MNRLLALVLVLGFATAALVLAAPNANADGCSTSAGGSVETSAQGNAYNVVAGQDAESHCTQSAGSVQLPPGSWQTQPVCEFGGSATCQQVALCADGSPMLDQWYETSSGEHLFETATCPDATDPVPQITSDIVLRALRRIDLPKSELIVQPPGGETLVNFATNFYTEQGQLTRTVHLLGQRVDLKIWPSQFGWRFGDGRSLATESAGSPYPDLEITHEYARAGGVRPSVDTTYAAQFRVNGGPWRDVNGTVTIPGNPVQLQVRTASPILVGYH